MLAFLFFPMGSMWTHHHFLLRKQGHQKLMVQKSCTSWDVKNPLNNGINYLSLNRWLAGFLPSTVSPGGSVLPPCFLLRQRIVGVRSPKVPPWGGMRFCSSWKSTIPFCFQMEALFKGVFKGIIWWLRNR